MKPIALVLALALPLAAPAAERRARKAKPVAPSVTGAVAFEPHEVPDGAGDGIGFFSKPSMWERDLDRLPYGDGSTYRGTEYGRKDHRDYRTRDGFVGEGPLHYGSGYSSNRVNWDFLLRR